MEISDVIVTLLIVMGVTFASMVLHELMHGLVAYWLGDDTAKVNGRLSLNPIKHIDPYLTIMLPAFLVLANAAGMNMPIFGGAKPVPINSSKLKGGDWGMALVGIAGPLTNLLLAFICYVLMVVLPVTTPDIVVEILYYGLYVNLGFFAFNILPIPPLDGSRVLYAVAPEWAQDFMQRVERVGLVVVFFIVMVASPIISKLLNAIILSVLNGFALIIH